MNLREQRQQLSAAGYTLERNGTKHQLWKKGNRIIPLSYGKGVSPTTLRSFKSILRKETMQTQVSPTVLTKPQPFSGAAVVDHSPTITRLHAIVGSKKFSLEERTKVRTAIVELRRPGAGLDGIAHQLYLVGFRTPSGKRPDDLFVRNQLVAIDNAAYQNKARLDRCEEPAARVTTKPKPKAQAKQVEVKPQQPATGVSRDLIIALLTEPTLSDKKKLDMISALVS